MVRLSFKKCYKGYIEQGLKRTTCRLGDKSKRFKVGQKVELTVGDRYHPQVIKEGIITKVGIKRAFEIVTKDLEFESPDCQTVGGLFCTMYHINKVLLKPEDIVTLISWDVKDE